MPSYTFDAFVVSDGTRAAFDAAVAVAQKSDGAHNPLVLVGPTRSGKTHLLYAIERAMRVRQPNAQIMRAPAQEFINQMILAIRRDTIRRFRDSIAGLNALLLDDAWIGEDKTATMKELLLHFDNVLNNDGQIVLTSHVAPDAFPVLYRWLESRHGRAVILTSSLPRTSSPPLPCIRSNAGA
jgi:chromosomal replication initiation ATPase DnaA